MKRLNSIDTKKFTRLMVIIGMVAVSPFPQAATTPPSPLSSTALNAPVSYADAVALAAPAVVSIKTTKEIPMELNPLFRDPFFRQFFSEAETGQGSGGEQGNSDSQIPKEILKGLGSGVIVSDKGYILTNNHVIKDVDSMLITLADGRTAEGKVVGTDPDTDLAVLQIKFDKLHVIPMGSSEKLRSGDVVLAIGNPFGLDKSVTLGIVSATNRPGNDIGILENLIQTDAAINPGNSGGALIDALGRLVGINTAIFTRSGSYQGIGFAIPIDQATNVMNTLIEGKRIIRGYLGIMMQSLNKEIRDSIGFKDESGVYVRAIVRGSPAQKSGLLPGDIILKINGIVIKDEKMGLQVVTGLTAGQNYPIEIFRKGDYLSFTVTPGERKQSETPAKQPKAKA